MKMKGGNRKAFLNTLLRFWRLQKPLLTHTHVEVRAFHHNLSHGFCRVMSVSFPGRTPPCGTYRGRRGDDYAVVIGSRATGTASCEFLFIFFLSATLRGSITHRVSVPAYQRRLRYQLHFFFFWNLPPTKRTVSNDPAFLLALIDKREREAGWRAYQMLKKPRKIYGKKHDRGCVLVKRLFKDKFRFFFFSW